MGPLSSRFFVPCGLPPKLNIGAKISATVFLVASLSLTQVCYAATTSDDKGVRPNVILIITDDK